jgi:hypothetical protein
MTITEMEGASQQVVRGIANYTIGGFLRRHNLDYPAVIPLEQIVVAQHGSPRGKNSHFLPGRERRSQSAVFAKLVRKHELRENRVRMLCFDIQYKHLGSQNRK